MEVEFLKVGNLLGSPDCKRMQHRAGVGTPAASAVWNDIFRIKTTLGRDGQSTSTLLLEPELPEAFPAVVDFSFISPGGAPSPIDRALASLQEHGLSAEQVRSVLVTHTHPDHFDPELIDYLPNAVFFLPPDEVYGHSRTRAFDSSFFGGRIEALDTPGHDGPHVSYLMDLPQVDLSLGLAGDLVMSHTHYLSRHHPLSFSNPALGLASLERLGKSLRARGASYQMVVPGHDGPFFLLDEQPDQGE